MPRHPSPLVAACLLSLVAACNFPGPGGPQPVEPDLIVESASLTITGVLGQGVQQAQLDVVVKNVGKRAVVAAKSFEVGAQLRPVNPPSGAYFGPVLFDLQSWFAPQFDPNGQSLPGPQPPVLTVKGPIPVGQSVSVSAGVVIVKGAGGQTELVAVADQCAKGKPCAIPELDETNNSLAVDVTAILW